MQKKTKPEHLTLSPQSKRFAHWFQDRLEGTKGNENTPLTSGVFFQLLKPYSKKLKMTISLDIHKYLMGTDDQHILSKLLLSNIKNIHI